jgi:hypothetical protein
VFLQPAHEANEVEVGVAAWESGARVGDGVEADDTAVAGLGRFLWVFSGCFYLDKGRLEYLGLNVIRTIEPCSSCVHERSYQQVGVCMEEGHFSGAIGWLWVEMPANLTLAPRMISCGVHHSAKRV